MKDLFALPLDVNQNLNIALHNLGTWTLLIDNGEFSTLIISYSADESNFGQQPILQLSSSENASHNMPAAKLTLSAISSFLQEIHYPQKHWEKTH